MPNTYWSTVLLNILQSVLPLRFQPRLGIGMPCSQLRHNFNCGTPLWSRSNNCNASRFVWMNKHCCFASDICICSVLLWLLHCSLPHNLFHFSSYVHAISCYLYIPNSSPIVCPPSYVLLLTALVILVLTFWHFFCIFDFFVFVYNVCFCYYHLVCILLFLC